MALRRNQVLAIVAIAGILALTLIAAGVFTATRNAVYLLRVNLSEKSAIYLQFKGAQLRAAGSLEGLKSAEPVALDTTGFPAAGSPESTLPIPADQLPEGVNAVKESFSCIENGIVGQLGICRRDEQKAIWQCDVAVRSWAGENPLVQQDSGVVNLEKLAVSVVGVPSKGNLGVGVRLLAGDNLVLALSKDGDPVEVQVRVVDAAGHEVAAKKGTLDDFGFS